MQSLRNLWSPRTNISIPTYRTGENEDNVDLQVKSLMYMFKRLQLSKSDSSVTVLAAKETEIEGLSASDREHLDKMYNLTGFLQVVNHDSHRVLVDWFKNRFRAMLILSHHPQMDTLPTFNEPHFRFIILEADASSDEYIRTLTRSDIYSEHPLPSDVRHDIAVRVLAKHPPMSGARSREERSRIILDYVHQMAVEIQVARIYKAMLGRAAKGLSSPFGSPETSPDRTSERFPPASTSPSRSPDLRASPERSPAASPTRGRFPSPDKVNLDKPHNLNSSPQPRLQKLSLSPQREHSPTTRIRINPRPAQNLSPSQHSSPNHSPGHSRSPSPTHRQSAFPPAQSVHSSHSSPSHSPSQSPSRGRTLKLKTSNSNLRLDAKTPDLREPRDIAPVLDAGRKHLLQQARMAVRSRIAKEQEAIAHGALKPFAATISA